MFTYLLNSPSKIYANHVLFFDDFTTNSGLWSEVNPWGTWTINSNQNYEGEVTLYDHPERPSYSIAGNAVWENYSYQLKVNGVLGVDKVILFRVTSSNNAYLLNLRSNYSLGSSVIPSSVLLGKRNVLGTNNASLLTAQNFPIQNNIWYSVKIDLIDNNIKVYIDDNLIIDFTDTSPITNGAIGLEMWPGGYSLPTLNLQTITYFDDVLVIDPTLPEHYFGPLELPFNYPGRGGEPEDFKLAFNDRVRSYFDHEFAVDSFVLYDGTQSLGNCDSDENPTPQECYDSHNGMDFSSIKGEEVLSAGEGEVAYASVINEDSCEQEKSGFGCIVIVKHQEDLYTMYAHLKKVNVVEGNFVTENSILGNMGNTGCGNCKQHLHFSVLSPNNQILSYLTRMTKEDWKSLVNQIPSDDEKKEKKFPYKHLKPFCSVKAENGLIFNFTDPNGWSGDGVDPWSKSVAEGGCGVTNSLLWKYDTSIN